jgi:hypothetical protein
VVPDQSGSGTGRREIVAVLRLVVSGQGSIEYGEAIEAETESRRTFRDWPGMGAAIHELVTDALAAGHGDAAGPQAAEPDRRST